MAHAAEELELVVLEAHARAAAVAEAAARELVGDVVDEDGETGGQALDGDHQGRSVGLARRQEAQHTVPPEAACGTGNRKRMLRDGPRDPRVNTGLCGPHSQAQIRRPGPWGRIRTGDRGPEVVAAGRRC